MLVAAFANFVKNGDPSTEKLKWSPLKVDEKPNVTVLKTFPYVESNLKSLERVKFWTNLTKDFDFDIIRSVKKPKNFVSTNELKARAARAHVKN